MNIISLGERRGGLLVIRSFKRSIFEIIGCSKLFVLLVSFT